MGVANDAKTLFSGYNFRSVEDSPFPHLIKKNVLPADVYSVLSENFPSLPVVARGRNTKIDNAAVRLPHSASLHDERIHPAWHEFVRRHTSQVFWRDINRVFSRVIRSLYPRIEDEAGRQLEDWRAKPRDSEGEAEVEVDCRFVMNTPVRNASSVKTAHVDHSRTLLSALYYMPDPAERNFGGDFVLGRWKRSPRFLTKRLILPGDWQPVELVAYRPNTLVAFVNHPNSIHAVTTRQETDVPRRYINMIAETRFSLFDTPKIGPLGQLLHWSEIRKTGY